MSKNSLAVIILAAGKGTRMKSAKPKVLHEIGGLPMIHHVIKAAEKLKPAKIVVVLSPGMDEVAASIAPYEAVIQKSPKGTGDAVKAALPALKNFKGNDVMVLYGDVPLIDPDELQLLLKRRAAKKAGICLLAMDLTYGGSYGRVVIDEQGYVKKIVEAKDASVAEKKITLCNTGMMCIDAKQISKWLGRIKNKNTQREYYLTDLPAIAAQDKVKTAYVSTGSETTWAGVNSRDELANAEFYFQLAKKDEIVTQGVTVLDPGTVYFSWDTKIGPDVVIEPNVFFGPGVEIGAGSRIRAFSYLEGAKVGKNVTIGPFARLRPGTVLEENVKIGNFVEVKKSKIGKGAKINHLAYVGDTVMGEGTNFSAGAITVNFDGFDKHQTVIGKNVMIGSNVNLVAPVTVNDGAFVAAGSTVTEDVPVNALSIGREPAKLRKGWAAEFRLRKDKNKDKNK